MVVGFFEGSGSETLRSKKRPFSFLLKQTQNNTKNRVNLKAVNLLLIYCKPKRYNYLEKLLQPL